MNGCHVLYILYIPCPVRIRICMAHVHKIYSAFTAEKCHVIQLNQVIIPTLQALRYIHKTGAQNLLHVLTLRGSHQQGVFTVVKVVPSEWSVLCTTVTHLHTY